MADFAAIAADPLFNETVQALIGDSTTPITTALNTYFVLAEGILLMSTKQDFLLSHDTERGKICVSQVQADCLPC